MYNSLALLSICILASQGLSTESSFILLQEETSTCSEVELEITCGAWDCSVKLTNEEFEAEVNEVYGGKIEMTVTDLVILEGDCEDFIITVTCSDSNDCPVTASEVYVVITFISEITETIAVLVPLDYGIIS